MNTGNKQPAEKSGIFPQPLPTWGIINREREEQEGEYKSCLLGGAGISNHVEKRRTCPFRRPSSRTYVDGAPSPTWKEGDVSA